MCEMVFKAQLYLLDKSSDPPEEFPVPFEEKTSLAQTLGDVLLDLLEDAGFPALNFLYEVVLYEEDPERMQIMIETDSDFLNQRVPAPDDFLLDDLPDASGFIYRLTNVIDALEGQIDFKLKIGIWFRLVLEYLSFNSGPHSLKIISRYNPPKKNSGLDFSDVVLG
jgi:hypothetical protein